ncbi:MAG TPA: acyltransferase [Candidatus Sulfomarinibacteraceae bacterium]|nr:acyltransferase [Candidatus Sulfomarinibacteraceae bacterium]
MTRVTDEKLSPVQRYQDLFVGSRSLPELILYELLTASLQSLPGALGIFLRGACYRLLFRRCGSKLLIGRNVTIRVPRRIELGNGTIIDDNAVLDAKGHPQKSFIRCGHTVEISRNAILSCKQNGCITLGNFVSIGRNVLLSARAPLQIGDNCSIGPYACILASGHDWQDTERPILLQDRAVGPISIGKNVWIGAHVTIMDGVTIGDNSIIGVGSVVTHDIPAYRIAAGTPARVVRIRDNPHQKQPASDQTG